MKPGTIIRRKTSTGAPIGPFMMIMLEANGNVYADTIGCDNPNVMLQKRNVYKCKIFSLVVSERVLDALLKGFIKTVQHPVDIRWNAVINKWEAGELDLVKLYDRSKGYFGVFTLDSVKRDLSLGEKVIKIELGRRLL